MRFALAATSLAAIVAIPLAVAAIGPSMSGEDFLSSVRCVAYQDLLGPSAELGAAKFDLNLEARRQDAEIVARARADVRDITRTGAGDRAMAAPAACAVGLAAADTRA